MTSPNQTPYVAPRLTELGRVSAITLGPSGSKKDANNTKTKPK